MAEIRTGANCTSKHSGEGLLNQKIHHRRAAFDRDVVLLAPLIIEARSKGVQSKEALTEWLNADCRATAIRKSFNPTGVLRIVRRLAVLGLGPGLRSLSDAASQRPYRFRSNASKAADSKKAQQEFLLRAAAALGELP
jgi:hypothetical protein